MTLSAEPPDKPGWGDFTPGEADTRGIESAFAQDVEAMVRDMAPPPPPDPAAEREELQRLRKEMAYEAMDVAVRCLGKRDIDGALRFLEIAMRGRHPGAEEAYNDVQNLSQTLLDDELRRIMHQADNVNEVGGIVSDLPEPEDRLLKVLQVISTRQSELYQRAAQQAIAEARGHAARVIADAHERARRILTGESAPARLHDKEGTDGT